MSTDNEQSVPSDAKRIAHQLWDDAIASDYEGFEAKVIEALSKLRGVGEPVLCVSSKDFKRLREADAHIKAWLPPATAVEDMLLYAAPQASAEVRNAALEEAAVVCDRLAQLVGRSGGAGALAKEIRALKSAPAAIAQQGKEDIYEEVYDNLCSVLRPHINDQKLPPSVTEAVEFLVRQWESSRNDPDAKDAQRYTLVGYFYQWELDRSLKAYPEGFPGAVPVFAAIAQQGKETRP